MAVYINLRGRVYIGIPVAQTIKAWKKEEITPAKQATLLFLLIVLSLSVGCAFLHSCHLHSSFQNVGSFPILLK
jgi:hypothetical protein